MHVAIVLSPAGAVLEVSGPYEDYKEPIELYGIAGSFVQSDRALKSKANLEDGNFLCVRPLNPPKKKE